MRFAHTNLIAEDWRRLASFYERVLGCERVLPERDIRGPWLDAGTGIEGAHIRGVHLRLPGFGPGGPTLEIFQYAAQPERAPPAVHRPGFGHIAFEVDDVAAKRDEILAAGGAPVGEVVSATIEGAGAITWTYVADPEGNVIELQHWAAAP